MSRNIVLSSLGASLAAGAVFVGVVTSGVSAQTPPTTTPSTPAATVVPGTPKATQPKAENPKMGRPGGMMGRHGKGGFGDMGPGGRAITEDGAARAISSATQFLAIARDDLAYATGKMDTANVQKWLNNADALIKQAQTAADGQKYERAGQTAQAAMGLIMVAEGQMGYTLGHDQLPSASQRPQGRKGHMPGGFDANNTTITQAQASRVLSHTYNHLVALKSQIKAGDATTYITEAQNAYQAAYAAYNAGKYNDAVSSAKLANQLSGVARHLQSAADAPDDPNAPVTVPAPNF